MGIPTWPSIYAEIRTAVHTIFPAINITPGDDDQEIFTSFQLTTKNIIEIINLASVNAPSAPFVLVQAGNFNIDDEFSGIGAVGETYRMPISLYYLDLSKTQSTVHAQLETMRAYFDNPAAAFTNFQVMERGMVEASGENPVMAEFAQRLRTTIRGGVVTWSPGWVV